MVTKTVLYSNITEVRTWGRVFFLLSQTNREISVITTNIAFFLSILGFLIYGVDSVYRTKRFATQSLICLLMGIPIIYIILKHFRLQILRKSLWLEYTLIIRNNIYVMFLSTVVSENVRLDVFRNRKKPRRLPSVNF